MPLRPKANRSTRCLAQRSQASSRNDGHATAAGNSVTPAPARACTNATQAVQVSKSKMVSTRCPLRLLPEPAISNLAPVERKSHRAQTASGRAKSATTASASTGGAARARTRSAPVRMPRMASRQVPTSRPLYSKTTVHACFLCHQKHRASISMHALPHTRLSPHLPTPLTRR